MYKKLFSILMFAFSVQAYSQIFYPFDNIKSDNDLLAYWYNIPKDSMHLKMMNQSFQFYSTVEIYGKARKDNFNLQVKVYQDKSKVIFEKEIKVIDKKTDEKYKFSFHNGCFKLIIPVEYLEKKPQKIVLSYSDAEGQRQKEIECSYHKLSGRIYDFNGKPFRAFVSVRPDAFNFNTSVWSDSTGYYEIDLPERVYNDIAIVDEEYGIKVAEAWGWHIIMDTDQQMDFKIGTGEVYNLNVWLNNGGGNTCFVSFRPMSMHLYKDANKGGKIKINDKEFGFVNLSPDLTKENVKVSVNGKDCSIISIQEYFENTTYSAMKAYLLQIDMKGIPSIGKLNVVVEYNLEEDKDGNIIRHCAQGYFQFLTNFSGLSKYN